jgi:hypothetical protein
MQYAFAGVLIDQRYDEKSGIYFCWTDRTEIESSNYATTLVSRNIEIALSRGDLFREGSHEIDLRDGKLVLKQLMFRPAAINSLNGGTQTLEILVGAGIKTREEAVSLQPLRRRRS